LGGREIYKHLQMTLVFNIIYKFKEREFEGGSKDGVTRFGSLTHTSHKWPGNTTL
jgi:hypothetical protein